MERKKKKRDGCCCTGMNDGRIIGWMTVLNFVKQKKMLIFYYY